MTRWLLPVGQSVFLMLVSCPRAWPAEPQVLTSSAPAMSQDAIAEFLDRSTKGLPLLVELRSGVFIRGKLHNYDDEGERLWLVVPNSDRLFNQRVIPVRAIRRLQAIATIEDEKTKSMKERFTLIETPNP
jgi:hypothetical protein